MKGDAIDIAVSNCRHHTKVHTTNHPRINMRPSLKLMDPLSKRKLGKGKHALF